MHFRTAARWQVLLIAGAILAGCNDDDEDRYEATLSGANENPANNSTATGSFVLTDDGDEFEYRLTVSGIAMPTMAHIHAGGPDDNGGILVSLFNTTDPDATFTGTLAAGDFAAVDITALPGSQTPISMDSLRVLLRTNGAYVNVHTVARPAGEIRGQIVAQ